MTAAGVVATACARAAPEVIEVVKEVPIEKEVIKEVPVEKVVEKVVEVEKVSTRQAPMLQELVKAGKLPPLQERLPLEPKVLSPARNEIPTGDLELEIGQYGGTLRSVQPDPAWNPDLFVMNDEPLLAAPGILAEGVGGGVAKSFEVSSDGKAFTFHMREGLKWSDGVPVTTEDVRFTYEDVLMNDKITPTFPKWMRAGNRGDGEPLKLEVLDAYAFRISFTEPYWGFPAWLAILQWKGYTELLKPKHHLKQFHADHTPLEELEPLIREEELAAGEWWTLFNQKDILNWELTRPEAVGFPVLNPWMVVKSTPTVTTYERNPYYFKVDAEGNQLPYIDGIRSDVVADVEMSQMKVLAGEVDFLREDATLDNLALYKESEEAGGYEIVLLDMHVSPVNTEFNLTHADPVWCQVVGDVRFRKALSLGIDRAAIIDAIYFGFAELPKSVPSELDPDTANALLDEMGMTERDADGFRLGPDGKTFEIPFENAMHASDIVPVTEILIENWKENLGIKATMKVIEPGLQSTRMAANELKASAWWHHGPELWWGALWDYIPSRYGPLWWTWFQTGGAAGEEPPEEFKKFMDLMNQSVLTSGKERQEAIDEYRRMMYENVWIIVTTERVKYPLVVSKKLGNIPHSGFAIAGNFAAEQFYFKE